MQARDPRLPEGTMAWHFVINGSGVPSVCTRLALAGYYVQHSPGTPKGSMDIYVRTTGEIIGTYTLEEALEKFLDDQPALPETYSWQRAGRPNPFPAALAGAESAPRIHKPARTQVAGGIKTVIWPVADRMWEEAGSPKDVPTVLALRKKIMDALQEQGVNRNTASSELGNWQKDRIK